MTLIGAETYYLYASEVLSKDPTNIMSSTSSVLLAKSLGSSSLNLHTIYLAILLAILTCKGIIPKSH